MWTLYESLKELIEELWRFMGKLIETFEQKLVNLMTRLGEPFWRQGEKRIVKAPFAYVSSRRTFWLTFCLITWRMIYCPPPQFLLSAWTRRRKASAGRMNYTMANNADNNKSFLLLNGNNYRLPTVIVVLSRLDIWKASLHKMCWTEKRITQWTGRSLR